MSNPTDRAPQGATTLAEQARSDAENLGKHIRGMMEHQDKLTPNIERLCVHLSSAKETLVKAAAALAAPRPVEGGLREAVEPVIRGKNIFWGGSNKHENECEEMVLLRANDFDRILAALTAAPAEPREPVGWLLEFLADDGWKRWGTYQHEKTARTYATGSEVPTPNRVRPLYGGSPSAPELYDLLMEVSEVLGTEAGLPERVCEVFSKIEDRLDALNEIRRAFATPASTAQTENTKQQGEY